MRCGEQTERRRAAHVHGEPGQGSSGSSRNGEAAKVTLGKWVLNVMHTEMVMLASPLSRKLGATYHKSPLQYGSIVGILHNLQHPRAVTSLIYLAHAQSGATQRKQEDRPINRALHPG